MYCCNFLKVDDDNLEMILIKKGYRPLYTLPCVEGKNVYLYEYNEGVNLEIKSYYSFFNQAKKFFKKYFWA